MRLKPGRQFYICRFLSLMKTRRLSQLVTVRSSCKTGPPEFLTFSYLVRLSYPMQGVLNSEFMHGGIPTTAWHSRSVSNRN